MNSETISVVVVENQPLMLTALSSALTSAGMNVLAEVRELKFASQFIQGLRPDVILLSVGDPSLDEFFIITTLRKELPSASILVLITGEFRGQDLAVLEYGAHMVLKKSLPRPELLDAIHKLAQRQRSSSHDILNDRSV